MYDVRKLMDYLRKLRRADRGYSDAGGVGAFVRVGYRYGGNVYDGRQPSSDLHAVFRNGYNGDDCGDGSYVRCV